MAAPPVKPVPGERAVVLDGPEPALVVGDLHFGFEADLERSGIHLPDQGPRMAEALTRLLQATGATRLLVLGDVKHGLGAGAREHRALQPLREMRAPGGGALRLEVVPGNHDGGIAPLLPEAVVHGPGGVLQEGVALTHGHTWPAKRIMTARLVLATHNHPVVALRDDLGHVHREPCFLAAPFTPAARARYPELPRGARLLVLPAFNPLLSGAAVNAPDTSALGPLFRNKAVDIERARVATLDGVDLGKVPGLRRAFHGL